MAKVYDGIHPEMAEWIARQPVFFVATAPLAVDGLVNLSPKGTLGTFRVVDERTFAYLDIFGSGVETVAHLRENGRICVMFCAFDGRPQIVRLHGTGRPLLAGDPGAVHRREEILERVWDEHWYGPTKTLDVHVAAIRKKLGDPRWIETVRGVGFRLGEPA